MEECEYKITTGTVIKLTGFLKFSKKLCRIFQTFEIIYVPHTSYTGGKISFALKLKNRRETIIGKKYL